MNQTRQTTKLKSQNVRKHNQSRQSANVNKAVKNNTTIKQNKSNPTNSQNKIAALKHNIHSKPPSKQSQTKTKPNVNTKVKQSQHTRNKTSKLKPKT